MVLWREIVFTFAVAVAGVRHRAGCGDALVAVIEGKVYLDFAREGVRLAGAFFFAGAFFLAGAFLAALAATFFTAAFLTAAFFTGAGAFLAGADFTGAGGGADFAVAFFTGFFCGGASPAGDRGVAGNWRERHRL